jgi:hypothetical protein
MKPLSLIIAFPPLIVFSLLSPTLKRRQPADAAAAC